MTISKTNNGIFVTQGQLENSGLAVALNVENFLFKIKKMNTETWQSETAKLITGKMHTVLAQLDRNERYPARILNAGGILTFTTTENEPLGIMVVREKSGVQLGFGKVELRDLDSRFSTLQATLDEKLKNLLLKTLSESKDKDDFIAKLKSNDLLNQFAEIESILAESDKMTAEILATLSVDEAQEQKSSFDRPNLNKFTVKAIKTAAIREITEEIAFEMEGKHLDSNRLFVKADLNREAATQYVQSILSIDDKAKSKFSAKEFNNDFESTTFVVTCPVSANEFKTLTHKDDCLLIKPNEVQIKMINAEKGFLQTSITGCSQTILGGGNQFTVAFFCKTVLGKQATFVPQELSSPATTPGALFATSSSSSSSSSAASNLVKPEELTKTLSF